MSEQTNDGGPAFPNVPNDPQYVKWDEGVSLRDYFAGQAVQWLLATSKGYNELLDLVKDAYDIADAMLAAREPVKKPAKDVFSAMGMEQPPFPTVKDFLTVQPDQSPDAGKMMPDMEKSSSFPITPTGKLVSDSFLPDWLQGEYTKEKGQALVDELHLLCSNWTGPGEERARPTTADWFKACEIFGFPPLSANLPPVPENGVYFGQHPTRGMGIAFAGWAISDRGSKWGYYAYAGGVRNLHYCADLSTESGRRAAWHVLKRIKEGGEG